MLPASSFAIVPTSAATVAALGRPPDGTPGVIFDPTTGARVALSYSEAVDRWIGEPFPLVRQNGNHAEDTGGAVVIRSYPDWSIGFVPFFKALHEAGLKLNTIQYGVIGTTGAPGNVRFNGHGYGIDPFGAPPQDLGDAGFGLGIALAGTLRWTTTNGWSALNPIAPPIYDHLAVYAWLYNDPGSPGVWQDCGLLGRWEGTP